MLSPLLLVKGVLHLELVLHLITLYHPLFCISLWLNSLPFFIQTGNLESKHFLLIGNSDPLIFIIDYYVLPEVNVVHIVPHIHLDCIIVWSRRERGLGKLDSFAFEGLIDKRQKDFADCVSVPKLDIISPDLYIDVYLVKRVLWRVRGVKIQIF